MRGRSRHRESITNRQCWAAHGIFVDLDDACRRADRIAFCSCPHRHRKNGWVGVQVPVDGPISDPYMRFACPAESWLLTRCPCRNGRPYYRHRRFGQESDSQSISYFLSKACDIIENATTDRNQPSSSRQLRDTTQGHGPNFQGLEDSKSVVTKHYRELGSNAFDAHRCGPLVDRLTRCIERLGYHVALEPVPTS